MGQGKEFFDKQMSLQRSKCQPKAFTGAMKNYTYSRGKGGGIGYEL